MELDPARKPHKSVGGMSKCRLGRQSPKPQELKIKTICEAHSKAMDDETV